MKRALIIFLTLPLIFLSCNDSPDDPVYHAAGVFRSSYGEIFELSDTYFKSYYQDSSGITSPCYEGRIVHTVSAPDENEGVIIIKYTMRMNYVTNLYEAVYATQYYAIAYRNLTTRGVEFSGAYKRGGVDSCLTVDEAIRTYTIDSGYFETYSACERVN